MVLHEYFSLDYFNLNLHGGFQKLTSFTQNDVLKPGDFIYSPNESCYIQIRNQPERGNNFNIISICSNNQYRFTINNTNPNVKMFYLFENNQPFLTIATYTTNTKTIFGKTISEEVVDKILFKSKYPFNTLTLDNNGIIKTKYEKRSWNKIISTEERIYGCFSQLLEVNPSLCCNPVNSTGIVCPKV